MPGGDGTGPRGLGPMTGKGRGQGRGRGRTGMNPSGSGPGGTCICPACGAKVPHAPGMPCYFMNCPKCGNKLMRA